MKDLSHIYKRKHEEVFLRVTNTTEYTNSHIKTTQAH